MYCRVVVLKLTDVSKVRTASITAMMIEAVRTSETSVDFNVTTRRYIPEDSKPQHVMKFTIEEQLNISHLDLITLIIPK
jgi:hypothetical protein